MPAKKSLAPILWPLGVVGALGVSLSVCTITVIAATSDKSFAIEDDYYAKAVAWDDTAAQRVRNEELGWNANIAVFESGEIRVELLDAVGQPISDAHLSALAFHHADRRAAVEILLAESHEPGVYRGSVDTPRAGVWQVRARARARGETFTATTDTLTGANTE